MSYLENEDFVALILWMWLALVVVHELISQVEKKSKKDEKDVDK